MLLSVNKISFISKKQVFLLVGSFLLSLAAPSLYAQEEDLFGTTADDSLLFGDEFDLGGDDFSFDFEESDPEAAGTTDEGAPAEAALEEDDFFGDFEEDADVTTADTTAAEDDWGLESSADYESLITRAADETEISVHDESSDHPLDLRRYVKGTIFEDTGLTFSLYSPQYVGESLTTWYSVMDFSLTVELPWHYTFDPVDLAFSVDVSSFSFNNSFPAGGDFRGLSIMPIARAESYGAEVELGLGLFYPTVGAVMGLGYSYQFHSLFVSTGYRWNWAFKIDPIGSGWWLEPRFTVGIKLW